MKWNWQHKNWPKFKYDSRELKSLEDQFLLQSGVLAGELKHIDVDGQNQLHVEIFSNEAIKTSEIEGEFLNRDSIQSSIRRHLGLKTTLKNSPPAEEGIS